MLSLHSQLGADYTHFRPVQNPWLQILRSETRRYKQDNEVKGQRCCRKKCWVGLWVAITIRNQARNVLHCIPSCRIGAFYILYPKHLPCEVWPIKRMVFYVSSSWIYHSFAWPLKKAIGCSTIGIDNGYAPFQHVTMTPRPLHVSAYWLPILT